MSKRYTVDASSHGYYFVECKLPKDELPSSHKWHRCVELPDGKLEEWDAATEAYYAAEREQSLYANMATQQRQEVLEQVADIYAGKVKQ